MIDSDFDAQSRGWGGRRKRRSAKSELNLSVLHLEIEQVNHENLRRIATARGMCMGEMLDKVLARTAKRLIAKGEVGLTPPEHV